jgi:hypothetical protein
MPEETPPVAGKSSNQGSQKPPIFQPDAIPGGAGGGLLMLGALVAAALFASRGPTPDQVLAGVELSAAAEGYKKAEKRLVEAIISADRNDLGRNEIARRVDGIYSRQTVLTLLGSADLLQRAMTALEKGGLSGEDVRVWQGKGRRLLIELIRDGHDGERTDTSRAVLEALTKAGISVQGSGFSSPVRSLACGKVLELTSSNSNNPDMRR